MIEEIVTELGKYTILVTGVAWLIRSIVTHFMSKDVETFKAQLQAASVEHEIAYRRLDAKFDEHLAEVYRRLFRLYDRLVTLLRDVEYFESAPSPAQKLDKVITANNEFWDYFLDNRVYVPPTLYKNASALAKELGQIANDYRRSLKNSENEKAAEKGEAAKQKFESDAAPKFSEIVAAVQKRLGVTD